MAVSWLEPQQAPLQTDGIRKPGNHPARKEFPGISETELDSLVSWSEQSTSADARAKAIDEVFSTPAFYELDFAATCGISTSRDRACCDEVFADYETLRAALAQS